MRLAHLADLHLGFRRYERLSSRGLNQREVDVGMAFTRSIDGVIAAAPDAVVVAGDVFHAVRPTNSAILLAYREFARLREALPDAPIVVIPGNHDTPRSTETVTIFGLLHELGLQVAAGSQPHWFTVPERSLAFLAVPHAALFTDPRPALQPSQDARYQVLIIHGDTPWAFKTDYQQLEAGGAELDRREIDSEGWSYVALGHYHVQRQVGERAWYAGSLDYVSTNSWGELHEERTLGIPGKGWLLVNLDTGEVERHPIDPPRRVLDLPVIQAAGLSTTAVDQLLEQAIHAIPGGVQGAVVRQVIQGLARFTARELDHTRIRAWKSEALHLLLDLRPPELSEPKSGSGAPGRRRTLRELLSQSLAGWELPPGVDRDAFVAEGIRFLDQVVQEAEES